jgi:lysophospholipase L1-like esterase
MSPPYARFVALGDSTTEGVGDEPYPDGSEHGWADRFAARLATTSPGLAYANLAVRGRRIAEVHDEQLAPALALRPDIVSVIAGLNDAIRPSFDLDAALGHMHAMQSALRASGATVLSTTFPDTSSFAPFARLLRTRLAAFNAGLRDVAHETGTLVLDTDQIAFAGDPRLWCEDRLHLNALGHQRMAAALFALAAPDAPAPEDLALPSYERPPLPQRAAAELRWARAFLLPWIGRRITGRSSGDGRSAKRPVLAPAPSV